MTVTTARQRPILFSGPMVRAILDGRKTQTRRVVKPQPEPIPAGVPKSRRYDATGFWWPCSAAGAMVSMHDAPGFSPYGVPGDLLWVRESWRTCPGVYVPGVEFADGTQVFPEFHDLDSMPRDWMNHDRNRPSIHMPKWACRLWLRVTDVRVQRVQEISEEDAIAEGVSSDCECWSCCDGDHAGYCCECAGWGDVQGEACEHCFGQQDCPTCGGENTGVKLFARLWDSINGKRPGCSWVDDPWVWAVTFERTEAAR